MAFPGASHVDKPQPSPADARRGGFRELVTAAPGSPELISPEGRVRGGGARHLRSRVIKSIPPATTLPPSNQVSRNWMCKPCTAPDDGPPIVIAIDTPHGDPGALNIDIHHLTIGNEGFDRPEELSGGQFPIPASFPRRIRVPTALDPRRPTRCLEVLPAGDRRRQHGEEGGGGAARATCYRADYLLPSPSPSD